MIRDTDTELASIRVSASSDAGDTSGPDEPIHDSEPRAEGRMSSPAELEELGRRIRKLRVERRMTLKQVEIACGLSATHLSEIERGRTSPTIGALIRISRSLGKRPSFFIEREELPDVARVAAGDGRSWNPASGVTAQSLSSGIPGSELFVYRVTFRAGAPAEWKLPSVGVPGDALYLVTRGSIQARLGEESFELEEGDAVQGSATVAHRLKNDTSSAAEILAILTRSIERP